VLINYINNQNHQADEVCSLDTKVSKVGLELCSKRSVVLAFLFFYSLNQTF
jgi:hypothetical protein